jgi:hypothetical protein
MEYFAILGSPVKTFCILSLEEPCWNFDDDRCFSVLCRARATGLAFDRYYIFL